MALREHRQQENRVLVGVDAVRDHGGQMCDASGGEGFGSVADGKPYLALQALHADRVGRAVIGQSLPGSESHGDEVHAVGGL